MTRTVSWRHEGALEHEGETSGISLLDALRRIGPDGTAAALAAVPSLRDELIAVHRGERSETVYAAKRDLIIEMAEGGCNDREIGDRLGCSSSNVAQRRRQMGIPAGGASRRWTKAEENQIRQMVARGCTLDEMADSLGRSASAVEYRRKQIRANYRCTPRAWSEQDDAILTKHWEAGTPIDDICQMTGCRSTDSVKNRARKLGLTRSHKRFAITQKRIREEFWACA